MPPVLLTNLLDHLVDQGLVSRYSDPTPAERPVALVEPRDGAPSPGSIDRDAVLGMWLDGGIASGAFRSSLRVDKVEFLLRTVEPHQAVDLHRQLRGELIDRRNWQMGMQTVVASDEFRPLQRLGSDSDGWSHDFAVLFTTYA